MVARRPKYGVNAETRVPAIAVAGDDAAADAGDQAAAAVESRSLGLCRGRAGAQSPAGAHQRRSPGPVRGEPQPERAEFTATDEAGGFEDGIGEHSGTMNGASDGFEPGQ